MEFINNPKLVLAIKLLLSLVFSFVLVWSLKFFTPQRKNSFDNFFLFVVLGSLLGFLSAVVYNLFPLLLIVVFLTYGGFLFLFLNKDYLGFLLSLLSFLLGILTAQGFTFLSALTVVVVGYLIASYQSWKKFLENLNRQDLFLVLQFLVIAFVIYPLLPNKEIIFDLNPKDVWKFVIVVSSVGFVAYFLLRFSYKENQTLKRSILLTALLGGTVSSTAVTLAFSRLSKEFEHLSKVFFLGITLAWAIMAVRVVFLASFVEPKLFMPLSEVMLPFILLTLGLGLVFYRQLKEIENPLPNKGVKLKNPLGFVESLEFALIYSLIKVGAYLAKEKFGNGAIYLLAFSSGIVDVDPLTLSLSKMVSEGLLNINTAVVGIVIAVVSNNFFKALYAYIFGSSEIKRLVSLLVILNLAYAGIVYWFLK
ncbi:MAG: DUF4010 domain-containing protein [Aquificota bacterium]